MAICEYCGRYISDRDAVSVYGYDFCCDKHFDKWMEEKEERTMMYEAGIAIIDMQQEQAEEARKQRKAQEKILAEQRKQMEAQEKEIEALKKEAEETKLHTVMCYNCGKQYDDRVGGFVTNGKNFCSKKCLSETQEREGTKFGNICTCARTGVTEGEGFIAEKGWTKLLTRANSVIYYSQNHARGKIISNNVEYKTIQEAINSVAEGTTIYIEKGVYNEYVEINKNINLQGGLPNQPPAKIDDYPIVYFKPAEYKWSSCVIKINSPCKIKNIYFCEDISLGYRAAEPSADRLPKVSGRWGAVALIYANATIECCVIGNSAMYGTDIVNASPTINACEFSGTSLGLTLNGKCNPQVLGTNFLNNFYGGVDITSVLNGGSPTDECLGSFKNCKMKNNSGYGVRVCGNSKTVFENCEATVNHPGVKILAQTNPSFINSEISFNNTGAFIEKEGSAIFKNCTFNSNHLEFAGNSKSYFENCFVSCVSDQTKITGAGTYFQKCTFTGRGVRFMSNGVSTFGNCKIDDCYGSGIVVDKDAKKAKLYFSNCDISNNNRSSEQCPSVDVAGEGKLSFQNCRIHGNPDNYGVSLSANASGLFDDCKIYDNNVPKTLISDLSSDGMSYSPITSPEEFDVQDFSGSVVFRNCTNDRGKELLPNERSKAFYTIHHSPIVNPIPADSEVVVADFYRMSDGVDGKNVCKVQFLFFDNGAFQRNHFFEEGKGEPYVVQIGKYTGTFPTEKIEMDIIEEANAQKILYPYDFLWDDGKTHSVIEINGRKMNFQGSKYVYYSEYEHKKAGLLKKHFVSKPLEKLPEQIAEDNKNNELRKGTESAK